ncbi:MAG: hypothetical protein ACREEM_43170 [Blastocatellia bacterium]
MRPEAALRAKTADYLRQSRALELRAGAGDQGGRVAAPRWNGWRGPTRLPAVLDELWAALGRDPFVIAAAVVNRAQPG